MSNPPLKPSEPESRGGRPSPDSPDEPGTPLKAVLTGLALGVGGSMVVDIVLALIYQAHLANAGLTPSQIRDAMADIPPTSPIQIIDMLLDLCCPVIGGYACARVVQRDEYRIGGLMAALSAFFVLMLSGDDLPDDMLLLIIASTVACVLLGVKYGFEYNERRRAARVPAKGKSPS